MTELRPRWGTESSGGDKVIVTCALTGVLAKREQCPHLPYTPAEIADEAKRAYDAGASVVHIHGRTDAGEGTFSPLVFGRIRDEVRARCPVLLNFSTGNLDDDTSEQEATIRKVRPEIAALNMGTMNYAKYSPKRRAMVFDLVFPNTFAKIGRLLAAMNEAGVKPELECFDAGHAASIWPLLDMGALRPPLQFSFIMGVLGGIPPSVDSLALQARQIPAGSTWEVIGIGREQWRLVASALVLGGNIRVGLEDNFYLPDGSMAKSNGDLVAKAVQMTRDMGREPASVDEARSLLGLTRVA
jgi:3-keto-5-aminohexanoate cleavage enzyme